MGRKYPKKSADGFFVRSLEPQNEAQRMYMSMIRETTVSFGIGPAGTGKTFIAAYIALEALLNKEVDKVVLTRPIVATEDIGYLPGTMDDKIHPYVLPLFDALDSHLGPKCRELVQFGQIEVLPLAYMRGRSLNRAFLILDEAQNTTKEQMKMFLTRIGYGSKMVITGDGSQSDLHVSENGLTWAADRLRGSCEDVSIVEFRSRDIVRHPLIESMLAHLDGPGK